MKLLLSEKLSSFQYDVNEYSEHETSHYSNENDDDFNDQKSAYAETIYSSASRMVQEILKHQT